MGEPVLLKGAPVAKRIREAAASEAAALKAEGREPHLSVIFDPKAPDARMYADSQRKACEAAGLKFSENPYPASHDALIDLIDRLNVERGITGLFLHTPAPAGIRLEEARARMDPERDVEGIHPANLGALVLGVPAAFPCTAEAAVEMMRESGVPYAGARAVIVGRSPTVGRAVALLLLAEKKSATVTVCHSATADIASETLRADFLIVAMGKPGFIRGAMVREGAVVIDVGTNMVKQADGTEKLTGDVAFAEVAPKARAITPVPGGVGPVTTACLVRNVVRCARNMK